MCCGVIPILFGCFLRVPSLECVCCGYGGCNVVAIEHSRYSLSGVLRHGSSGQDLANY